MVFADDSFCIGITEFYSFDFIKRNLLMNDFGVFMKEGLEDFCQLLNLSYYFLYLVGNGFYNNGIAIHILYFRLRGGDAFDVKMPAREDDSDAVEHSHHILGKH